MAAIQLSERSSRCASFIQSEAWRMTSVSFAYQVHPLYIPPLSKLQLRVVWWWARRLEECEAPSESSAEQDSSPSSSSPSFPSTPRWLLIWRSWEIKFHRSRWLPGGICGQVVREAMMRRCSLRKKKCACLWNMLCILDLRFVFIRSFHGQEKCWDEFFWESSRRCQSC